MVDRGRPIVPVPDLTSKFPLYMSINTRVAIGRKIRYVGA